MIGNTQVSGSEDAIQAAVRFINTVSANPEALQAQLIQLDESAKASALARDEAQTATAKLEKVRAAHDAREAAVSKREVDVGVLEAMQREVADKIEHSKQVASGVLEAVAVREAALSKAEDKLNTLADSLAEQVAAVRRILDK